MLKCVHIEARDLSDAWFQAVYKVLAEGREFTIDRGSFESKKRLEFDWITIQIKYPGTRPLLPDIPPQYGVPNPVAGDYLDNYLPYLMTGHVAEGESYTYGQRLTRFPISFPVFPEGYTEETKRIIIKEIDEFKELRIIFFDEDFEKWCINQIEAVIWIYKNRGVRNNQMVLQIAHPTDILLQDPPCLRQIDTRLQDGKLSFFVYFRSWDLWNGFPANLGGIQLLKEYMASCIGVEDGDMIATSKGLHLYDHCYEIAKCIRSGSTTT
jgi:thymidylate synthase